MSKEINNIELLKKLRGNMPVGEERTRMSVIIANYMGFENPLTPLTADEVCEALSDYLGKKVTYNNRFRFVAYIHTLIGRFYEGKSEIE